MKNRTHNFHKKIQNMNISLLLTVLLFFVIATVLTLTTIVSWLLISMGIVRFELLVMPLPLIGFLFCLCALIVIVVMAILRKLVLTPLRHMVDDMKRLASGDFSVRVENHSILRPLELQEFTDSFNKAAAELGSIELLRKDFINNFAHEFKTPITSLGGFADLLLEDPDMSETERQEYLQIIRTEARRLANLANNVLALNRVETQSILTNITSFNITEQLRQTVLMMQQKWSLKEPDILFDADECIYVGNEALLKEVWINLLDNAVKFSPRGSIIRIILNKTANDVNISVQDCGPGIDENTQAHIFDLFYQGDTSHKTDGNGLGLPMVKKIVSLHGGGITIESAPNKGSTFYITLPLSIGAAG